MFVPVSIRVGAGGEEQAGYSRIIELAERFDALGERTQNMAEPLVTIGEDLHAQVAAAFGTEGASGATGHWQPLSEIYGAWKAVRSNAPILVGLRPLRPGTRDSPTRPQAYVSSGEMRRELLDPLAMHVTPRRLLYAPTSEIAGYHETGTDDMPARPPVDVSVTFLHSVDRTFLAWFAKLADETGLNGPGSAG
jgi:hypothetical protein